MGLRILLLGNLVLEDTIIFSNLDKMLELYILKTSFSYIYIYIILKFSFSSVQFSRSAVSDSL